MYVCVCFVSLMCVCLARAPAALKLGIPASRSLIYFLYTCLKPYKMYKSINCCRISVHQSVCKITVYVQQKKLMVSSLIDFP